MKEVTPRGVSSPAHSLLPIYVRSIMTNTMARSISNLLTALLAAVGCVVALLLTVEHFSPAVSLPCGAAGGCAGVLHSTYSQIGPIPTSLLGFGMYALLIALVVMRHRKLKLLRVAEASRARAYASGETLASGQPDRLAERAELTRLDAAVFGLALLGAAISWALQYNALFMLHEFCPWCFTSCTLITIVALLATRDYLIDGRNLSGEQRLLVGVLCFVGLMLAIVYGPLLILLIRQIDAVGPTRVVTRSTESIVPPWAHMKGDPKAPYTIVEFADYQCPACREAVTAADTVLERRGNLVKLVFRNYPLPMHHWARDAAQTAEAAAMQGKFWQMHDFLYKHQADMESPAFTTRQFAVWAQQVGLNVNKLEADATSSEVQQHVDADVLAAQQVGVKQTPTFAFIGPNGMWTFAGGKELIKGMADTTGPMWQKPGADGGH